MLGVGGSGAAVNCQPMGWGQGGSLHISGVLLLSRAVQSGEKQGFTQAGKGSWKSSIAEQKVYGSI